MEKEREMKGGIFVFDDVEELDFVGPWEVFTSAKMAKPDLEVFLFSDQKESITCAKGMKIVVDQTFDEVKDLDVLLVPGGAGNRRDLANDALLQKIKAIADDCQWVTSVCTGAFILLAAGLLEGKKCTTHWRFLDKLEEFAGKSQVISDVRFVRDGQTVTAAGVSAGIDMALWLVGQWYDPKTARLVQKGIQYDPAPPYQAII